MPSRTGWSTDIPCFDPVDIIKNIEKFIKNKTMTELYPYYNGFKGKISKINDTTFKTKGIYEIKNNKIIIKELPVGVWTDKYKDFLESITIDSKNKSSKQIIKYYNTYCTDIRVHFELFMDEDLIEKLDVIDWNSNMTKLEKTLKLCSIINLSNMVLYDKNYKIKKYSNVNDIILEFCEVRLDFYKRRKEYLIKELQDKINILDYKIKFIYEFINETIKIIKTKKDKVIEQLQQKEYPLKDNKYDYLLKISIDNLTEEKIEELENLCKKYKDELSILTSKTEKELWMDDITIIKSDLSNYGYDFNKKKLKIYEK